MKTIVMIAAALALGACGAQAEEKDGATLTTASGSVTVSNTARMPTNLPSYAPIYPGAQVTESVVAASKTGPGGGVVGFVTGAKPAEVMAFYEAKAAAAKLTNRLDAGADPDGAHVVAFSQPDTQRSMTVSVGPDDEQAGRTKASLVYNAE